MRLLIRLCLVGALLASGVMMLAPERSAVSGGELTAAVAPSIPGGILVVPATPLCELTWKTHETPISIRVSYIADEELDVPKVEALKAAARDFAIRKIPWVLIFAVALGILIADGIGTAGQQQLIGAIAVLAIVAAIGGLGYVTIRTFNADALHADPQTRCGLESMQAPGEPEAVP